MRRVGGGMGKRSEWWCEDVRAAVAEKRHANGVGMACGMSYHCRGKMADC